MYSFYYKDLQIMCLQTFDKEFDCFVDGKLVLTEWSLIPTTKDKNFENKIINLIQK